MKRAILTVLAMLMLIIPTYATDDNGEPATTANTYKVYDFAGLQDALEKADDGDIIELQNPIDILESITIGSADKHITLELKKQDYHYYGNTIFTAYGSDKRIELRNMTFDCQNIQSGAILYVSGSDVLIDKCIFKNISTDIDFLFNFSSMPDEHNNSILIRDSSFESLSSRWALIKVFQNCNMVISGCTFSDMRITYRTLIVNEGTISLNENHFQENTVNNCYSTVDSRGTLYLDTDMSHYAKYYGYEPQGWYRVNGEVGIFYDEPEKIEIDTLSEPCNIVFFTDKPKEEDSEDTQPPQGAENQTEDDDTTDEGEVPQEPIQSPEGEETDDPSDNPGQSADPSESNDPADDSDESDDMLSQDNPTDTPPQDTEQATEPSQDDGNGDTSDEGGQDIKQPPQTDNESNSDEKSEPSVKPPQEQIQTGDGESENNSADNSSEDTETPIESLVTPPVAPSEQDKDYPSDNPENTPNKPQQSQESADSNNSGDDDYTPPANYYPAYRPTRPSATVTKTEDADAQPDSTSAPAKPPLVCNGAVIDVQRTVVLLGYGDGLLHETDSLTRAQMAQIIFRLLTPESIELVYAVDNAFDDVTAAIWCNEAVSTIANAGIVVGYGDGCYHPNDILTWAQVLTVLTRFTEAQEFDLQYIDYDGWALQAVETAVAMGWIEDSVSFNIDSIITRGDFVDLLNGVLEMY